MLRAAGEARRIDRAIRRLQDALKGIPSRGVRLTWRGGELRTTIHWARDDAFWWAFEPRAARDALLGQALDATCGRFCGAERGPYSMDSTTRWNDDSWYLSLPVSDAGRWPRSGRRGHGLQDIHCGL